MPRFLFFAVYWLGYMSPLLVVSHFIGWWFLGLLIPWVFVWENVLHYNLERVPSRWISKFAKELR